MKAVLEFTYPQDETKLKHALRGEEYYLALVEIERIFMCERLTPDNSQVIVDILEKVLTE
jgi:hypothetical protein